MIVSLCKHLPSSGTSSLKEEAVSYSFYYHYPPTPNSVFSDYSYAFKKKKKKKIYWLKEILDIEQPCNSNTQKPVER